MQKTIHQLKAGDIVRFHAGKFLITQDAYPAFEHYGPSDVAIAPSICIEGECGAYYSAQNKTEWAFQGNYFRGSLEVL